MKFRIIGMMLIAVSCVGITAFVLMNQDELKPKKVSTVSSDTIVIPTEVSNNDVDEETKKAQDAFMKDAAKVEEQQAERAATQEVLERPESKDPTLSGDLIDMTGVTQAGTLYEDFAAKRKAYWDGESEQSTFVDLNTIDRVYTPIDPFSINVNEKVDYDSYTPQQAATEFGIPMGEATKIKSSDAPKDSGLTEIIRATFEDGFKEPVPDEYTLSIDESTIVIEFCSRDNPYVNALMWTPGNGMFTACDGEYTARCYAFTNNYSLEAWSNIFDSVGSEFNSYYWFSTLKEGPDNTLVLTDVASGKTYTFDKGGNLLQ